MSDSLAEQLANVKLRPSKNKTKDFSDPKLAGKLRLYLLCERSNQTVLLIYSGFSTKDQISTYQKHVLEANIEEWQMLLVDGIKKYPFFSSIYVTLLISRNISYCLLSNKLFRCSTLCSHI